MPISDELQKLAKLHASGELNDEEFARAKTALLAARSSASPVARQKNKLQPAKRLPLDPLQRLDKGWLLERERFMVVYRGVRQVPGITFNAVIFIALSAIYMLNAYIFAYEHPGASIWYFLPPALFLLVPLNYLVKGIRHKKALARYAQRRAELIANDEVPDDRQP